ncbi:hypothetical protein KQH54_00255 [bacterium]|nr:hypothetical protein [bacterium]
MKNKTLYLFVIALVLVFALSACGGNNGETAPVGADSGVPTLVVGLQSYEVADLEAMTQVEATFNDVIYVGVPVTELLSAAGYDLSSAKAVKAIASDGYSVNYEPGQLSGDNVIIAYATVDGALTADDGDFRMVLPDEEGSMNLRMLVELTVVE